MLTNLRHTGFVIFLLVLQVALSAAQGPGKAIPIPPIEDNLAARAYLKTVWGAKVTEDEVFLDMLKAPLLQIPPIGLTPPQLPDPFSDKHLEVVGKVQGLRKLTLLDTFVVGQGLSRMDNRDEITHVTIQGRPGILDDAGPRALAKFAKLKVVDLTATRVTPKGISELLGNPSLERVSVNSSDAMLEVFAEQGKLGLLTFKNALGRRTLRLESKEVSDKALASIKDQAGLEFLVLQNTAVTDASAPNIAKLRSLVGINVEFTRFTTEGLRVLEPLRDLEEIYYITYRKGSADALALFPKLKYLAISGGDPELLKQVAKIDALEHLSISLASLTGESLAELHGMKNLRELRIYNDRSIPANAREQLRSSLPKCKVTIQSR